jgi:hypothetical protein
LPTNDHPATTVLYHSEKPVGVIGVHVRILCELRGRRCRHGWSSIVIVSVLQPFPDLKAMHGDFGSGLEPQPDAAAGDFKHSDFENTLEAARAADYY